MGRNTGRILQYGVPSKRIRHSVSCSLTVFPATVWVEGAQFNGPPFPATASAEGAQFNVPPFPATASAEAASLTAPLPHSSGPCVVAVAVGFVRQQ